MYQFVRVCTCCVRKNAQTHIYIHICMRSFIRSLYGKVEVCVCVCIHRVLPEISEGQVKREKGKRKKVNTGYFDWLCMHNERERARGEGSFVTLGLHLKRRLLKDDRLL